MCDFLIQTSLSFIWTWIYLIWDVCYIDVLYSDTYIYLPDAKWVQVHMDLYFILSVLVTT